MRFSTWPKGCYWHKHYCTSKSTVPGCRACLRASATSWPLCVAVEWEAALQAANRALRVGNKGRGLSLSSASSSSSLAPCNKPSITQVAACQTSQDRCQKPSIIYRIQHAIALPDWHWASACLLSIFVPMQVVCNTLAITTHKQTVMMKMTAINTRLW